MDPTQTPILAKKWSYYRLKTATKKTDTYRLFLWWNFIYSNVPLRYQILHETQWWLTNFNLMRPALFKICLSSQTMCQEWRPLWSDMQAPLFACFGGMLGSPHVSLVYAGSEPLRQVLWFVGPEYHQHRSPPTLSERIERPLMRFSGPRSSQDKLGYIHGQVLMVKVTDLS